MYAMLNQQNVTNVFQSPLTTTQWEIHPPPPPLVFCVELLITRGLVDYSLLFSSNPAKIVN